MSAVRHNPGDPFADWDAAYVLGALSADDRAAYESHLPRCDRCRASVAAMAGMPGLLARVPVEHLDTDDSDHIPSAVLPRLLGQAARDRRRDRWRLAAAGLVAAACVLGLIVAVGSLGRRHTDTTTVVGAGATAGRPLTTPGPVLTLAPRGQAYVNATAQIQDVAWGTRIQLKCMHLNVSLTEPTATASGGSTGPEPPGSYAMVVVGRDHSQTQLATWHEVPGKTVQVEGDTDLRRSDITQLLVKDAEDHVVLEVAV